MGQDGAVWLVLAVFDDRAAGAAHQPTHGTLVEPLDAPLGDILSTAAMPKVQQERFVGKSARKLGSRGLLTYYLGPAVQERGRGRLENFLCVT